MHEELLWASKEVEPVLGLIVIVSIFIKILSLIMVSYAFRNLSPVEGPSSFGILTKYFVMKRRYVLLRFSLLFVAGLILVEMISMGYTILQRPSSVNTLQLLFSDVVFVGLILLLSRIYGFNKEFKNEWRKTIDVKV